jgi:NADH dehydrogenase [ubiquinone] 1 alpha subcomplex assembly factor 5
MFLPRVVHSSTVRRQTRAFAAIASGSSPLNLNSSSPYQIFDRHAKVLQKDRAATRDGGARSKTVDYVREEVAERMMERFLVCFHTFLLACGPF